MKKSDMKAREHSLSLEEYFFQVRCYVYNSAQREAEMMLRAIQTMSVEDLVEMIFEEAMREEARQHITISETTGIDLHPENNI